MELQRVGLDWGTNTFTFFFFFKDGQRIGGAAAIKESLKYYLDQSSLTSALLTFWAGPLFVVGSDLRPAGLSAASQASIH